MGTQNLDHDDMSCYRDVPLPFEEVQALYDLEKMTGPLPRWYQKTFSAGGNRHPPQRSEGQWMCFGNSSIPNICIPQDFGFIEYQGHVVALNLHKRMLYHLPDSITGLTHLEYLDLSYNSNFSIREMVVENSHSILQNQERGDYEGGTSENSLHSLPIRFGSLSKLKVLRLDGNTFCTISSSIRFMRELISLEISHNRLKNIPIFMRRMTQLEYLGLDHNEITDFPPSLLKILGNRTPLAINLMNNYIDMSDSSIIPLGVRVQMKVFANISKLLLDFQMNPIKKVPFRLFKKSNNLHIP